MNETSFQSYGLNLRDCKATDYTVHDLSDLVTTQCRITVLSTLPTPQPGVYAIVTKDFYPNAEKHWVSEITAQTSISYSSQQLAQILNERSGDIVISQH